MGFSLTHIILLLVIVLVLFGAGKLPQIMGDLGKGLRNFKSGMNDPKQTEDKTDTTHLPPPTV